MTLSTLSQVTKRIRQLAVQQENKILELGEQLIKLNAVASGAQFKAMVKREGVGSRKAYYLINIVERLRPHMRYRARLQKLGWTKCQLIANRVAEEEFSDLLKFAEEHSVQELKAYGRRPTQAQRRCVLLYFTPEQYRQYERALLKCGARRRGRGVSNKEAATIRMAKIVDAAG
ncbi:hypothetical protein [Bradyrhizobium ottawaense]|uniref:hypothetical protein n=1 Tax=Bradyrhizobium ottawaense TaxID=931866 RepID=UPI0027F29BE0|nr:hypothetical protein BwSG20_09920 [Bradyrhizobium ottawaense]